MGDLGDIQSMLCGRIRMASSVESEFSSHTHRRVAGLMSPMSPAISDRGGMNRFSIRGHGLEMPPEHVPDVPRASHPGRATQEIPVTKNKRRSRP